MTFTSLQRLRAGLHHVVKEGFEHCRMRYRNSGILEGHVAYNLVLNQSDDEKPAAERSGQQEGQLTSLQREVSRCREYKLYPG